jgi:short-subunit dehydrogenase
MVLVSALGAAHGLPNIAHDSAAKAHVLNLGEALNHELRPAGVKVTVMVDRPAEVFSGHTRLERLRRLPAHRPCLMCARVWRRSLVPRRR